MGSRRVHLAGCTTNPTSAWVVHQARQLRWQIQDGHMPVRFLNHDHDAKFSAAFDTVFTAEDITIMRPPVQAPTANACAERWIRSVREECLDKLLILGERQLRRVLSAYIDYDHQARPGYPSGEGLDQQCPVPEVRSMARDDPIERCDIVGGVLHE